MVSGTKGCRFDSCAGHQYPHIRTTAKRNSLIGQAMARAALPSGDRDVLLVQLRTSFLLVRPDDILRSYSPKSRASQIGEGEAEVSGQSCPVATACHSRKTLDKIEYENIGKE